LAAGFAAAASILLLPASASSSSSSSSSSSLLSLNSFALYSKVKSPPVVSVLTC
jgi:hypothetical protein